MLLQYEVTCHQVRTRNSQTLALAGHSHVYERPPKELMHAISPGPPPSAAAAVLIISGAAKQDAM